jgi:putative exosortase-associated protein (TIGR04073 family)
MKSMATRKKLFICMSIGMALLALAWNAPAGERQAADNSTDNSTDNRTGTATYQQTEPPRRFERFGRGVTNVFTSPLEIPAQIYVHAAYQQDKTADVFPTLAGFIEGVPLGIIRFPWRLAAGVYDICTFPFARCDQSIIRPEYISFSHESVEKM